MEMRLGLPKMAIPVPIKLWPGEVGEGKRHGLVGRDKELRQAQEFLRSPGRALHIWADPGVVSTCQEVLGRCAAIAYLGWFFFCMVAYTV